MGKNIKLLCYGDSNTYGFDPRFGLSDRLPKDIRWAGRMDLLDDYTVFNEGMNGRQIPHSGWDYASFASIVSMHADAAYMTVMLGTNDLFHIPSVTADLIAVRMEKFLRYALDLKKSFDGILLIAPPPVSFYSNDRDARSSEASKGLSDVYCALAEKYGLLFADAGEWDIQMAFDGVHFSEEGHARFFECVRPLIDHMVENKE